MVALKYLSNFWRTLKTSLINCKISLMLTWSKKKFQLLVMQQIKNYYWYKTYVRVVTLSTQDNVKLVKQLSFQGINRRFVLSGKDRNVRENYNKYIFFQLYH